MKCVIDAGEQQPLNWSATGSNRVIQNVMNLLNTVQYEIAYDRLLGLRASLIDRPLAQIQGELTAQVIEQIRRFEPRATVIGVELAANSNGDVVIKVEIDL